MDRLRRALALGLVLLLGLPACGSEPTPEEPEGAYLAFRDALFSGHPRQLWEWVSDDTKQLYRDAVSDLQALAESVGQLSPADRAIAYERTAVSLASRVETGEDLFAELIRLENLRGDERYLVGTAIDEIRLDDADRASVLTEAGQEVALVREEDGLWRVASLARHGREQLAAIAESVSAVDVLAAESAYMRRSHCEIVRLLGGDPDAETAADGADEGSGQPAP